MSTFANVAENTINPAHAPLLLRVEEAAAMLRLSRSQVYGMILAGDLPCVRIGRSVRVPSAPLADYVRKMTRNADNVE
ncbi:MAG: helix-turn-helix domain-containing protein [Thermomicrobiales bacterium]